MPFVMSDHVPDMHHPPINVGCVSQHMLVHSDILQTLTSTQWNFNLVGFRHSNKRKRKGFKALSHLDNLCKQLWRLQSGRQGWQQFPAFTSQPSNAPLIPSIKLQVPLYAPSPCPLHRKDQLYLTHITRPPLLHQTQLVSTIDQVKEKLNKFLQRCSQKLGTLQNAAWHSSARLPVWVQVW